MPSEYTVKWYEPTSPVQFEVSQDAVRWTPIVPYDVTPLDKCHQGKIQAEPGYVRSTTLFGDTPETYNLVSNIQTLPEPMGVGLIAGALVLCAWGRRRG